MKILLVSGKCLSNTDSSKYCEFIKELVNADIFKTNEDKIAYVFPGDSSEINIKAERLINFAVKSVGDKSLQIPDLNPLAVREIYNFFVDFNADIVVSFDSGFLGLMSQVWAIRKKVPYALYTTNSIEDFKTKTSRFLKGIFMNTGLSSEFLNNFYHNCTAIFVSDEYNSEKLQNIAYMGKIILVKENPSKKVFQKFIYNELESLIKSQPRYIKSTIFKKIIDRIPFNPFSSNEHKINSRKNLNIGTLIFAGGAVLTSIIAFTTWKNLNRIKEKITKKETK